MDNWKAQIMMGRSYKHKTSPCSTAPGNTRSAAGKEKEEVNLQEIGRKNGIREKETNLHAYVSFFFSLKLP